MGSIIRDTRSDGNGQSRYRPKNRTPGVSIGRSVPISGSPYPNLSLPLSSRGVRISTLIARWTLRLEARGFGVAAVLRPLRLRPARFGAGAPVFRLLRF